MRKSLFERIERQTDQGFNLKTNTDKFSALIAEKEKESLNKSIKEYLFTSEEKTKEGVLDAILTPENKDEDKFLLNLLGGKFGVKVEGTKSEKLINEHLFKKTPETRKVLRDYMSANYSEKLTKILLRNYLIQNQ